MAGLPHRPKHEDWLNDEITLAGVGEVEHEIVFRAGTEYQPIAENASE